MTFKSILIANRGEIAIRIARAASDLGIRSVAVYSDDDATSLHVKSADAAQALGASGAAAYLDIARIIACAKTAGCEAIHPGYGFLSENVELARACEEAGIVFIGPSANVLSVFGDKARARALAERFGVPVLAGTAGAVTLEEARTFFAAQKRPIVIKAIAGGGGRGMRVVKSADELEAAYQRCRSEARAAFGNDAVYAEVFMPNARHIEVQVVGDGKSAVHIWERDCTLQRRHQKIVECAPAPNLKPDLRRQLCDAAVWLADDVSLKGLATFEFLVDPKPPRHASAFAFIEANPRLQVEHTITEEVTGIDLVAVQIELLRGSTMKDLGLKQDEIPEPRGYAVQLRVNMEKVAEDGSINPSGGTLRRFAPPSGPGVRVDTYGYEGYTTNPSFDSLLAKVIAHGPDFQSAMARAKRALSEFVIDGVETNIAFLHALVSEPAVLSGAINTHYVEDHTAELVAKAANWKPTHVPAELPIAPLKSFAAAPSGTVAVAAPMQGKIVTIDVKVGDVVAAGTPVAVLEAMKMEHLVGAAVSGRVHSISGEPGVVLAEGEPLLFLSPQEAAATDEAPQTTRDPDFIRADLAESNARHAFSLDENRPEAVARRRKTNQRTARENLEQLCDPGSFIEYGAMAFAAQRRRRSLEDLIKNTPGDGIITGVGTVNADEFGEHKARCAVMAYDYTVLAGTQGGMNHQKKDRLLKVAEEWKLPIVCFAEGGGGRPGDTDIPGVAGLDVPTFRQYAKLSGLIPRIGINSGRCFAGNAALLGCSDVIIAAANSNIGMGGPAMIEGGGLGVYRPEEVGPMSVQVPNGVVDVAVADEIEAIEVAKKYLGYFQGAVGKWEAANQKELRHLIPENRLRVYESRKVIETLADKGSVLELRPEFGPGMLTAFIRIEGQPFGLIGNNPMHLAGAIDAPCADKAARFMQLCDAFGLPIISLCDTPGFMVGPEAEKHSLVRRVSRMFIVGGALSVPLFAVVLRKGYGLGAQAMAGGSFHAPFFIVSWPTGEFGGMGLEGAVRLGYRKELDAQPTPEAKEEMFKQMVAQSYARGKAINMAAHLEIDDVIDPADTRRWIMRGYRSVPPRDPNTRRRSFVDTW